MGKNLPAMQETGVQSLGWEDPLEKEMATHSSILAWRIPWTGEPDRSIVSQRVLGTTEWLTLSLSLILHCIYIPFILLYPFIWQWTFRLKKLFFFLKNIYLRLATSGLSCSMRDLQCSTQAPLWLWRKGSVAAPWHVDLSPPARDQPWVPRRWIHNHRTTKEVPKVLFLDEHRKP